MGRRTGWMAAGVLTATLASFFALNGECDGPCTSVRVTGCGRKARVCVRTAAPADASRLAIDAFRDTYKCASPTVSSYASSCSESAHDPCDLRR